VIKFKCIYCGQRIVAKDDGVGKKGKCPKCDHLLTVPASTKGRPAISPVKEPMPDQPEPLHVEEWEKNPLLGPNESSEVLTELFKESFGFLIPTYDKLSVFLMAVTLIILCIADSRIRNPIETLVTQAIKTNAWPALIPLALAVAVLCLCCLPVFIHRQETVFEKRVMVAFAVLTNLVTGITAAIYTLKNTATTDWLLIFPIWNIINAAALLFAVSLKIVDEECISDRQATAAQIIFGAISVLIVFAICNYAFKLHWAVTYSICIIYTTSFDRALQSVFPGLTGQKYEQYEV
jgi:hypothetical protein